MRILFVATAALMTLVSQASYCSTFSISLDTAADLRGSWSLFPTNGEPLSTWPSLQPENFPIAPDKRVAVGRYWPTGSIFFAAMSADEGPGYSFFYEGTPDALTDYPSLSGVVSGLVPGQEMYWAVKNVRDSGGDLGTFSGDFCFSTSSTNCIAPVPLPAAVWLLLSGLVGLGYLGGRRKAA